MEGVWFFLHSFSSTDTPSPCKFTDHLEGGNVAVPLTPVASIVSSFSSQFVAIDWEGVGVERSALLSAFPCLSRPSLFQLAVSEGRS